MAAEKAVVQFCLQMIDPVIKIDDFRRYEMHVHFPVYDLTKYNILKGDDAALISFLDEKARAAGIL